MAAATEDAAAKRSAAGVATLRFLGSFERDSSVRNPDRLSGRLLSRPMRVLASVPPLRHVVRGIVRRRFPGGLEYHIARTRHLDQIVCDSLDSGVDQLVVLGAGYDTRAQRLLGDPPRARVLELDHPATLARKRQGVERAFGGPPEHVEYVPIDFNEQELPEILGRVGYRTGDRALFLWEGVTMFITPGAVDRTLEGIASSAAAGSSIAFDYVARGALERPSDYYGGEQAARHFAKTGEPWLFGIEPDSVVQFLSERGFDVVSHLTAADLERQYLRRSDGELLGHVPAFHGIVHAAVRHS